MKIVSEAQRRMFERCLGEPEYAKERGIDPSVAQQMIDDYLSGGSPKLPERATPKTQAEYGELVEKEQARPAVLLQSMRGED